MKAARLKGKTIRKVHQFILTKEDGAQDERLEEVRQRVERELTVLAVEDLRKDDWLRADTARRAGEIIAAMQGFYQPMAQEVA